MHRLFTKEVLRSNNSNIVDFKSHLLFESQNDLNIQFDLHDSKAINHIVAST